MPLFSVGLAYAFYGERLRAHQWFGIVLAVAALTGLSMS
ncbi:EamA family transporter [Candidatus Micrarchaeota archaeon]|nr:EamA family transporter [Candidatus Micrarchaeota archaeon]